MVNIIQFFFSSCRLPAFSADNIQPSHLWDDDWSNTAISKPARVVNVFDLGDGGPPLLDLRFADDMLLFAGSAEQFGYMLHKLMTSLGKVGFKRNAAKTKALTIQTQPVFSGELGANY